MQTSIEAYFNDKMVGRNPSYGPVALVGPSGTGKTLVAKAVSAALGTELKTINGHNLSLNHNLYSFFLDANETSTTLFIDEAQGVNHQTQERMLTIISEGYLEVPTKSSKRICRMPVPKCPIIIACMSEYYLIPAMRTRMRIYCRFDYYSNEDLIEITRQRANALQWKVESDEILTEICIRAKNVPRLALRNLQLCWNVTRSLDLDTITMEHVKQAFMLSEIDQQGLDYLERSYLRLLSDESPLALNMISARLGAGGIPTQTIKTVIEPYLIQEGLVSKEGSLRIITQKGRNHIVSNLE